MCTTREQEQKAADRKVAEGLNLLMIAALSSAVQSPTVCDALLLVVTSGADDAAWVRAMRKGCEALWWSNRELGEAVRRFIDQQMPEFTRRVESAREQRREEFAARLRKKHEAA